MYVTRPRSVYGNFPGAVSVQPQSDGLYSGQLIVSDEASGPLKSFCCGLWRNGKIKRLPFPQDKILQVVHSSLQEAASVANVWFLPVLDQPLSSNRYYVIKAKGRHKGQAYACSREGDTGGMCCFDSALADPKTRPFDHRDRYQQFEIHPYHSGGFFAKSVEWDGYPPSFLRRGGWEVYTSPSSKLPLQQAPGLHSSNASNFPELNFPLQSKRSTPIVIGKWYCPFVFVKEEDCRVDEQMRKSMVYELSLKKWWERIFSAENESNSNNVVVVDARVKRLTCFVHGVEGEKDGGWDGGGFVWFKVKECCRKRGSVGLSCGVFEKMRWVQEMRGWFDGERDVRVFGEKSGENGWRKFGCYVLVESFVFRRLDGSLLINFNFRNTERIECKWE
ncbi:hypothetical protein BUALT_Bualt04G0128700 [Buddleja alternifolia]|uniref:DUF1262 family protein n=1 Tax=Buddleja alternifolia TaxID=168488 RepID=A0AAV6XWQ4_9LAMI|nr:hypothetical protein BUALT_Bualt04G0128700 [Buddleja alternifolia]